MKRPWYAMKRSPGSAILHALNCAFLVILAVTVLYPFWTTILLSFSPMDEASSLGFKVWIREWTTGAYRYAFSKYGDVLVAYGNSIFRTVIGTSLGVAFALAAAYPLSKRNLPGRTAMTLAILVTMFFSGGLVPTYLVIRSIGLIDSRWVLILPTLVVGFHVVIVRNFLMTLDNAYEEAAFMDGASYLQILVRIVVPLSKAVIATVALWNAVRHWNAWFDALIYIRSESKIVLQILLRRMMRDMEITQRDSIAEFMTAERIEFPSEALKAAITILTIGPIVLFYPFLQRYFIRGIYVGSLKG